VRSAATSVTAIDGKAVTSSEDLANDVQTHKPVRRSSRAVARNGKGGYEHNRA